MAAIAAAISICALIYCQLHDQILLYGDAVAHINIARRVFDSRDPGPAQLGSVWLPLPHILMMPFIVSRWAWHTGLGGSIPSMAGYVAGVLGVFRLLRGTLGSIDATDRRARLAAWFGALVFAANPNLIYMQATAMGESLYLAFFVWATVFLGEFVRQQRAEDWSDARRSLVWCGVMLLCGVLSRYDGWFAAALFGITVFLVVLTRHCRDRKVLTGFAVFALLIVLGPAFWLGWNSHYFGNALEWINGPYSARAIMQRSTRKGDPPHPGYHSVKTAAIYYVKCAKLNLAGKNLQWGGARYGWPKYVERTWPMLTLGGILLLLTMARQSWSLLMLWTPLLFYPLAMAYGGVPIFMPVWWPYSYYNVRYGLQLVPAVAVFVALVFFYAASVRERKHAIPAVIAILLFVGVSYGSIWKTGPVCLHEPQANSLARNELQRRIGLELQALPQSSVILIQLGYYSGALELAGIPLKRTINETDYSLWDRALADPVAYADYLVAGDDRVGETALLHADRYQPVAILEAEGQPTVTIYCKRR